jgi:hypothetical protein
MVSQRGGRPRRKKRQLSLMNVISMKKNGIKDEVASDDFLLTRSQSDSAALSRQSLSASHMRVSSDRNELNDLYIIDSDTLERVRPNEALHYVDNEILSGYMFAMLPTDANQCYFVKKRRKIELQLQVKFKKIPKNQIHIGCELVGPLKIGIWQRAFLKGILNIIERRTPDFHYNLSGIRKSCSSGTENNTLDVNGKPYLSMPFDASFNALIVTKEGDLPPALGEALDMKWSHSSVEDIDFNTSDTYTFGMWSGYIDLLKWKCDNIAHILPFPLQSIIGNQVFTLKFFTRDESSCGSNNLHSISNDSSFMRFEFGHVEKSKIGPSRHVWSQSNNDRRDVDVSSHDHLDQERDDVEISDSENTDTRKQTPFYFSDEWICSWGYSA